MSEQSEKDTNSDPCEIHYFPEKIAEVLSPKWANVLRLVETGAKAETDGNDSYRAYKKALETLSETVRFDELLAAAAEHPGMKATWGRFFIEDVIRFLRAEGQRLRDAIEGTLPPEHRLIRAEHGAWFVLSPHGLKCSLQEWLERPTQPGESQASSASRVVLLGRLRDCAVLK